jgi:hypothetical protein
MNQHVYARLAGHQWTVLPLAPFRLERVPNRRRSVVAWRRFSLALHSMSR